MKKSRSRDGGFTLAATTPCIGTDSHHATLEGLMTKRFLAQVVLVLILGAVGTLAGRTGRQTSSKVPAAEAQQALLKQYCLGCHNDKLKTGGLALDAVDIAKVADNPEVWERVLRKVGARHMPPMGRPRPDEAGYNGLVSYLTTELDGAAAAHPNPGRTDAVHRLNRTEYQNAIRDLLALDVDITSMLPKDDASFGFDNIGSGSFSATLLERYLAAAQKVSRLAVGTPLKSPVSVVSVVRADVTQEKHVEGLPFGTRGGTVVHYTFPRDGEYQARILLARNRDEYVEGLFDKHQIEVSLDGKRVELFTVEGDPPPNPNEYKNVLVQPDAHLRVRFKATAGPHDVAVAFLKQTNALFETEREPYQAAFNMDRHNRPQPAVSSVSIAGPFTDDGISDTPSRERIFVCRPQKPADEDSCAQKIVSTLARHAYRRPVNDADITPLMGFYKEGHAGGSFEDGIENALRAILVNPEFLARVEKDPPNIASDTNYRISDLELASRLSFFLWSSIPDDELIDLASRGKLRDPEVLQQQVKRMLADPRSESLATSFAEQWLYLRNLEASSPDMREFPDFDDNLRQSFRQETEMFFDSILKEDRSALEFLTANYTFLNERLARHYGIPGVIGSRFRRVRLPAGSVRGGLFGQGSILTVTSYGNRTSPVLRGKWVMQNILGVAPPPPPPNVPRLPETPIGGKVLSMRERMVAHRSNPACAGCHSLMDPIGLSMENFDAVGRWRDHYEGGTAIDATGGLPDGSTFEGVAGLREAVLNHPQTFVTTLTQRLLTYASGRGLDYYDAPTVRGIVRNAQKKDYKFSALIFEVVNSAPFQFRRSQ
jgi:mono/diheme cytochrome c family protein